jgi:tetratricopeptide (TPR) repeat protein/DNA-binding winged helix-turn-helix (wHTH) protein/TolB-like protein
MPTNSSRNRAEPPLRVADLRIFPERVLVCRGEANVPIRQQTLRVLLYLIEHRDRLVSREELHTAIWGDTAVTPDALVQCIVEIRKILGDSSKDPRFVRTVPKVGYAFIGPLEVEPLQIAEPGARERDALPSAQPREVALEPPARSRWSWRIGAAAVMTVAVLLGVLGVTRTTKPRSVDWPAAPGRKRIVVLPFQNHSRDQAMAWLETGLPNMLITGLGRSPALSPATLTELRPSLGRSVGDVPSVAEGLAIANSVHADAVASGSFTVVDGTLRVDVRIQTPSGVSLGSDSVIARRRDAVLTEVDRLAARMIEALGAGMPSHNALETGDVMTRDLDAYRDYILGVQRANAVEPVAAIELFEKAVNRDPEFAMAHARIGATYAVTMGAGEKAQPYLEKAFQLSDRLRENDRLWILAWYSVAKADFDGAIAPLRTLIAKYSDDIEAYSLLSKVLTGQERWAEALTVIDQGFAVDPDAKELHNRASSVLALSGKPDAAIEAARRFVAVAPREANAQDSLGLRLASVGRFDEAADAFDRALALNPQFDVALFHKGNTYFAEGRYRDAAAAYEAFMRVAPQNGGRALAALAWIAILRGDKTRAWQLAERAVMTYHELWPGTALAAARRDLASYRRFKALDTQNYSDRGAPWPPILVHYASALDLQASGRIDQAIEELRAAVAHSPTDWGIENHQDCLAQMLFEVGRWEDAAREYQRLTNALPWVARYHYRLGQLADKRHDAATALDEYRRFLSLWPKADRDLPEVVAAVERTRTSSSVTRRRSN